MPVIQPPSLPTRFSLFKGFLRIFIPMCILLGFVGAMHYYTVYTTEHTSRAASETLNVDLAKRMIATEIDAVVSDLLFLSDHISKNEYLHSNTAEWTRSVEMEFKSFAKNKGLYDQIRYLDKNGMEIVRVNYNGGNPQIVPDIRLQNKQGRYYFQHALALEEHNIYISPMDLNIEEGKIEFPLKPMIRFGARVTNVKGEKLGIIFLNYFGDRLINHFTRAAANIADHIELLNADGFWLSSPRHNDEWGFMFGNENRFQQRYQTEWTQIKSQNSGQFISSDGMFTYTTIFPEQVALSSSLSSIPLQSDTTKNSDYHWKIVARVSPKELSAALPFFLGRHWTLYTAMLGLLAIGAWLLSLTDHRHRLAEAQSEYERRFRHTLENMDLAAIALNLDGEVTFCNDFFLRITGWHRDEIISKNLIDRFIPTHRQEDSVKMLACMDAPSEFPSKFEIEIRTRDNSERLIAWNNTLSYDANGHVIGVTAIGEDITEQRHTENELRKLIQAVEQSPSIVLITNQKGLIEYVNPKFTEVTGYQAAEVIGKNPRVLKSGETSSDEYSELWNTVIQGGVWRGEFHNRKKNGELFWEAAAISGLRDPDGNITNFLAVKEDITQQKKMEKQIEAHNQAQAKTQALTAMGRMASMVAHDLRNPLSSVKMTLQILGRQSGDTGLNETNELRQIALGQIHYMEDILSDMLTFSRPDALDPEWISIEDLLKMAMNISQRRIDEAGVELIINTQPGLPTFHGDPSKLRQVMSNLIINAVQATGEAHKPRVSIESMLELGQDGTSIRVEICDNGTGIEPDRVEHLFEPFYTTRSTGTGLGLAIVKRILDQHQASIRLTPNPSGGCCAIIILPITPQFEKNTTDAPLETTEL